MRDNLTPTLAAPRFALAVYLEALLRDAPEAAPADASLSSAPGVITRPPCAAPVPAQPTRPSEPFACLLFKAGGLLLAAPLERLGGVVPWAPPTSLPAQAPYLLGLLPHLGKQVLVLDPLPLLRPHAIAVPGPAAAHSIILSASREWGLACEALSGIITVHPERVRWRGGSETQPWFSGVVSDRMCALIDMDVLARRLASKPVGENPG